MMTNKRGLPLKNSIWNQLSSKGYFAKIEIDHFEKKSQFKGSLRHWSHRKVLELKFWDHKMYLKIITSFRKVSNLIRYTMIKMFHNKQGVDTQECSPPQKKIPISKIKSNFDLKIHFFRKVTSQNESFRHRSLRMIVTCDHDYFKKSHFEK